MWAEAVNASCYIHNRIYSSVAKGETPYALIMNKKPDLSHIRIFGARAYVHVPKARRVDKKFSQRAQPGFLVGYETDNSFRVYLPEDNRVVVSRDVNVDENAKLNTAIDAVMKVWYKPQTKGV